MTTATNKLELIGYGNVFGKFVNIYAENIEAFEKGNVRMFFKNNQYKLVEVDSRYYVNAEFDAYANC